MELSEREYMVRGLGYLRRSSDIENVVVSATASGNADPGRRAGPGVGRAGRAPRRRGARRPWRRGRRQSSSCGSAKTPCRPSTRQGAARRSRRGACPQGVVVRPVYDRSDLIERSIGNLRGKLLEESSSWSPWFASSSCSTRGPRWSRSHAAAGHPHRVHRHAWRRGGRGHHVAGRHRHRHRRDDRRRHRDDREHAQAPRARAAGARGAARTPRWLDQHPVAQSAPERWRRS